MPPTWPSGLPQEIERNEYRYRLPDNLIRTSLTGASRTRRRSRIPGSQITGSMLMTKAEISDLETFHDDDLADGVLSFDFPNPEESGTIRVAFREPPSWGNLVGDEYAVRIALEVQP